jgi:hypothetical protein
MNNLSQGSLFPSLNLNPRPLECEAGVLVTPQQRSVSETLCSYIPRIKMDQVQEIKTHSYYMRANVTFSLSHINANKTSLLLFCAVTVFVK